MKRNLLIIGVTGVVLLGGAVGVGAFSEQKQQETNHSNLISQEKAEKIAVNEVNGSSVDEVELDKEDGRLEYEVEVRSQNGDDDIDVEINAQTGEILKVDDDKKKNYDTVSAGEIKSTGAEGTTAVKANNQLGKQPNISKEEAVAIATKVTPGKVVEAEYDDGEYEIEIHTETHEVEYEIDARTGKILEKDMEDLDDDDDDDDRDDD